MAQILLTPVEAAVIVVVVIVVEVTVVGVILPLVRLHVLTTPLGQSGRHFKGEFVAGMALLILEHIPVIVRVARLAGIKAISTIVQVKTLMLVFANRSFYNDKT